MRHVIVDGYNVLHALPEAKRRLHRDQAGARQWLVEELALLHDFEGCRISLVFDGQSERNEIEEVDGRPHFAIVYAARGLSADTVVERLASKGGAQEEITVVSADNLISSASRASGAFAISPEALEDWLSQVRNKTSSKTRRWKSENLDNKKLNNPFDRL